ncbi:hypothetical protein LshimejAT787_0410440 [Lyophyllum shimeji]|uniref:DUF6533 domain-containing protein n=1 Tax=Lyophyllum shimeji TaxID=47721 RepID=A0A9P3PL90_LYOSH|nr:hypothetical protein LshimejAT787_0410440 [Lyophyllum shimeji]
MSLQRMYEETVNGDRICNYSGMAAFTFFVHEWLSSADKEVEQIWKGRWTPLKSLYMFLRILSMGTQLFPVILAFLPFSTRVGYHSLRTCRLVVGFQGAASQVLMLGVQIILIMRVDALYYAQIKLRLLLRLLYLVEIVVTWVVFAFSMPKIEYGLNCLVTEFPGGYAVLFFVLPMVVDCILFVLTMIKFYQAIREGWGREPVIYRFLKDGIWAFALPFTIVTINVLCMGFLPGPLSSIAYSWVIAIPAFAGCRLILNMRHLLRSRRSEGPPTYPEQDFMIATTTRTDLWSHGGPMAAAPEHDIDGGGYEMSNAPTRPSRFGTVLDPEPEPDRGRQKGGPG